MRSNVKYCRSQPGLTTLSRINIVRCISLSLCQHVLVQKTAFSRERAKYMTL